MFRRIGTVLPRQLVRRAQQSPLTARARAARLTSRPSHPQHSYLQRPSFKSVGLQTGTRMGWSYGALFATGLLLSKALPTSEDTGEEDEEVIHALVLDDDEPVDDVDDVVEADEFQEDETHAEHPRLDKYMLPSTHSAVKLFCGNSNHDLATEVAYAMNTQLGRASLQRFADGEVGVSVHDNVRNKDCFVLQSVSDPTNDSLMELLLLIGCLKRASARRVTAVIPYFAYARQSHNRDGDSTVAAADVAKMLEAVGVDQVVAVDLHRAQIGGFFSERVPVENLDTIQAVMPYFASKRLHSPVIACPSGAGFFRARKLQKQFLKDGREAGLCLLYARDAQTASVSDLDKTHHQLADDNVVMELVGDVTGCDVIVVDDMIDSASRVVAAAKSLKGLGARNVYAFATHGLFTGDAIENINDSDLKEVVCFNTTAMPPSKFSPKIRQLSVASLIAETIRRIHIRGSVTELMTVEDEE